MEAGNIISYWHVSRHVGAPGGSLRRGHMFGPWAKADNCPGNRLIYKDLGEAWRKWKTAV